MHYVNAYFGNSCRNEYAATFFLHTRLHMCAFIHTFALVNNVPAPERADAGMRYGDG